MNEWIHQSHLLEAEQFGLQVSDCGVTFVLFLRKIPVGSLQFGEPGLKLLRAALMSCLQLAPQLLILLLQPRLDLYTYTYTAVISTLSGFTLIAGLVLAAVCGRET